MQGQRNLDRCVILGIWGVSLLSLASEVAWADGEGWARGIPHQHLLLPCQCPHWVMGWGLPRSLCTLVAAMSYLLGCPTDTEWVEVARGPQGPSRDLGQP